MCGHEAKLFGFSFLVSDLGLDLSFMSLCHSLIELASWPQKFSENMLPLVAQPSASDSATG